MVGTMLGRRSASDSAALRRYNLPVRLEVGELRQAEGCIWSAHGDVFPRRAILLSGGNSPPVGYFSEMGPNVRTPSGLFRNLDAHPMYRL